MRRPEATTASASNELWMTRARPVQALVEGERDEDATIHLPPHDMHRRAHVERLTQWSVGGGIDNGCPPAKEIGRRRS